MKSGPSRSTIVLGAKPSVITPPLPRVTTSSDPKRTPPPLGGPSTMPGKSAWPLVGPGPAVNDTTDVAKRDGQDPASAGAAASSVPASSAPASRVGAATAPGVPVSRAGEPLHAAQPNHSKNPTRSAGVRKQTMS